MFGWVVSKSSTSNEEFLNRELHGSDLGLELRALIRGHSTGYDWSTHSTSPPQCCGE